MAVHSGCQRSDNRRAEQLHMLVEPQLACFASTSTYSAMANGKWLGWIEMDCRADCNTEILGGKPSWSNKGEGEGEGGSGT